MKPTAEQTLILDRVQNTAEPLLLSARAGAAKTTTLTLIAEALPNKSILALAFNKKIAMEMEQRLPSNAKAATLNSVGNQAWKAFRGRFSKIDKDKGYKIVSALVDKLTPPERQEILDDFPMLLSIFRAAKVAGYLPVGINTLAKPLVDEASFFEQIEEIPTDLQRQVTNDALRINFKMALEGEIDFDDQIYLPALMPVSFSSYDVVMIDEAQDLSFINHVLLRKIVKRGRLIAVGDACQAIYGFRGAEEDSMSLLQAEFGLTELSLTICFRSAKAIIRNARWRAPDMQWTPDAPEGLVERKEQWTLASFLDGDTVICRNNAPLFRLAIDLLRAGRNPELSSGDVAAGLLRVMKKFGKAKMSQAEALTALAEWEEKEYKKHKDSPIVHDKAECIRLFLDQAPTLGAAIEALEEITRRSGHIFLMTGHKSKGLEFDRVWFLDAHLCRPKGQDRNVRYVIETRAKRSLFYIRSDGRVDDMALVPGIGAIQEP